MPPGKVQHGEKEGAVLLAVVDAVEMFQQAVHQLAEGRAGGDGLKSPSMLKKRKRQDQAQEQIT